MNCPALSIRQPWAWLILHYGKDIENRDWPTNFRGRCLIHASKSGTKRDYEEAIDFLAARCLDYRIMNVDLPSLDQLQKGDIIALTFAHNIDEPEYPTAWQYGRDGQPRCTQFIPAGEPIPEPRCTATMELF